ncbi:putative polyamine oxidase 5 [Forsythia ovata]|uniref:Polyamine oxidase 5 n=1 Tax=Forsythia ovata TaxID=205694 RepID=A0ABD1SKS1_9LAMI
MVSKKPRIVIIGAGMAGLTAANKLYTATCSKELFELLVVEGGTRIGGRINTSEFCGQGLDAYWRLTKDEKLAVNGVGNWSGKSLEEAIFAMHENTQRTYTSAGDLRTLDYDAESEYKMFPGEEITIAKGYLSVIESLASVLPSGLIQLGRKVVKIEWQPETKNTEINNIGLPVKLHFCDGSTMYADHVIVTVSLGVLKQGIRQDSGMFSPPLPSFKTKAISRLGYGVVDKLFLQLSTSNDDQEINDCKTKFPFLQMIFHQSDSNLRHPKIPWWIRRTAFLSPIYSNSRVLLSWFAGKEALHLESLNDEEILNGVSTTVSNLLSHNLCNSAGIPQPKFAKVLRTKWGTDPLFLGIV